MDRVMSRSYYGKWYVPPEGWSKLQSKALEDQKVDGVPVIIENPDEESQKKPEAVIDDGLKPTLYHADQVVLRPKPIIMGQQVEPQQVDWNLKTNMALKKNLPKREITLTKMLSAMSQEDLLSNQQRKAQVKSFAKHLRGQSELLLSEAYLSQVIRLHPGVAETYFYELRKIVEHQIELERQETIRSSAQKITGRASSMSSLEGPAAGESGYFMNDDVLM
ncbi:hypothetical protein FGO68_gene12003 [Halteria grandinella]|uniref:Uncharacterized protein n=1 Tax=Halteria grandinella TaxID=5974 RepID=A0A8J8SV97_HALGN|nr:hypothetical protein FGO68_gene12003 [Halteria grandinella]